MIGATDLKAYLTYLFDVGGTLITFDAQRCAAEYVKRAQRVGVTVSPEHAMQLVDELNLELPARMKDVPLSLLPASGQRAFWLNFWAEGFRRMGVDEDAAQRFANEVLDRANGGDFQKVYADVVPALDSLCARGKRLGIISNFSPNCESLLRELGLAHYFDFFIVSGILGVEKPDAQIFHAAMEASGRNAADLVYVGDSVYHDIQGAHNAGLDAILIDRANRFSELETTRVRDLREL